jgi:hypothetical protein
MRVLGKSKEKMMPSRSLVIGMVIPILIITGPNVYAKYLSDTLRYNDGYANVEQQASIDFQSGNSFNTACDLTGAYTSAGGHTTSYCDEWTDGYTSTYKGGSPQTQTSGVSSSSQENFPSECYAIQGILVQSCNELVNPDGTLTPDGNKASACISNGIDLGLGRFAVSGGDIASLPPIIKGLNILSSKTGSDGVVNWDSLGLDQLSLLKRIFH